MDFFVFISEEWLLVSTLLILVYLYFWRERQRGGPLLSAHAVVQLLNSDEAVLLDVRDSGEYKVGHIAGAINIPHSKLKDRLAELERYREKAIVVTDKMGQHSGHIGRTLLEQGYDVRRLDGGMSEWKNQTLPTVKGEDKGKNKGKNKA